MSKKISILGAILGASLLLVASAANAGITTYTGSSCVQNEKTWSTTGLFFMGPEVTTITGSTTISCPISQQGGNVLAATVSGHNFGASVSCDLSVRDRFNDSGFSSASVTTSVSPKYTLNLGAFPHFFSNGTKSVLCTLPAAFSDFTGTVSAYTISEG